MSRLLALICGAMLAGFAVLAPPGVHAQQRTPTRTGQPIVIHGQVPTPQVVTVRPRVVPDYDRRLLGPEPPNRSFWPVMLPGYQLIPERQITGRMPHDAALATAPAAPPAPGAPAPARQPSPPADTSAAAAVRNAQIDSMRADLVRRRARLDSLERAMRGLTADSETTSNLGKPVPRQRVSAADSAARAAEIQALFQELESRRARLDSLETLIRTLGRPRAPSDTSHAPRDTTRVP